MTCHVTLFFATTELSRKSDRRFSLVKGRRSIDRKDDQNYIHQNLKNNAPN